MNAQIPISRRDFTGQRFGRLTAISRVTEYGKPTKWRFRCDCGNEVEINIYSVLSGLTKSCGCIRREKGHTVHGGRYDRLHGVWADMLTRCYNDKVKSYKNYGGRGIGVCDEWRNDYAAFRKWALANGYDPNAKRGKCTIDRIDNDGNYCPENCRWVDMHVQRVNQRPRKQSMPTLFDVEGLTCRAS